MKKALFCILMLLPVLIFSQDKDIRNFLPGEHELYFNRIKGDNGTIKVAFFDEPNIYLIKGMQQGNVNGDNLTIEGTIQLISDQQFIFDGVIEMTISTLNEGKTCRREGVFNFREDPSGKKWELSEKNNPCYSGDDLISFSVAEPKK